MHLLDRLMTLSGVVRMFFGNLCRWRDQSISLSPMSLSHPNHNPFMRNPWLQIPPVSFLLLCSLFIYGKSLSRKSLCISGLRPLAHIGLMMYMQLLLDHIYCQYLHKTPFHPESVSMRTQCSSFLSVLYTCQLGVCVSVWFVSLFC